MLLCSKLKKLKCLYMCILQLQVVAINLKDSHLLDNISDQECTVGAKSFGPTDSQADISSNHYYDDPCSEVTGGDVQEGRKVKYYFMHAGPVCLAVN